MLVYTVFAVPSPGLLKYVCLEELSTVIKKNHVALNKENTIFTILQKLFKKLK